MKTTTQRDPLIRGREPLFERPGVTPAGLRDVLRDIGGTYVVNGFVGLVFAASGPIAVTLAVGVAGGLTEAELASWVFGILLSAGVATLLMSLIYRQPLGFAWSIPGTVLLGPSLQHLAFGEVVGAFFTCGVLTLALGLSGVVRRLMDAVPMPMVMAMVAAVFLRFGTDVVESARVDPVVVLPMVAIFLLLTALPRLGRLCPPVLGTLIVGIVAVVLTGQFAVHKDGPTLANPVFTTPEFTWEAQLELLIPLMLTVLVVQNGQGVAVLRAAGHHPPVNSFAVASGAFSVVNAMFGAVSACVTGPTNVLLTSSGQRHRQYTAALFYGALSIGTAILAPTFVRFLLGAPETFILALGGIAMLPALKQAFVVSFSGKFSLGALVTFVVTISGLDLFNIHAAFWGISVGYAISRIVERREYLST